MPDVRLPKITQPSSFVAPLKGVAPVPDTPIPSRPLPTASSTLTASAPAFGEIEPFGGEIVLCRSTAGRVPMLGHSTEELIRM